MSADEGPIQFIDFIRNRLAEHQKLITVIEAHGCEASFLRAYMAVLESYITWYESGQKGEPPTTWHAQGATETPEGMPF